MAAVTAAIQGKTMTLSELRVFELKQELEKRGLDKSGIKLALVERLEGALREEGHDPKTYKFVVNDYGKSPTVQKGSSSDTSIDASAEQATELTSNHQGIEKEEEIRNEDEQVVVESESKGGKEENSVSTSVEEPVEVKMEELEAKEGEEAEEAAITGQEDHDKAEDNEEQMEVSEVVVEEANITKENANTRESDEGTVKEMAEEVNYEDEEMSDAAKIQEEDNEKEKSKESGSESTEKPIENKVAEGKTEQEKGKIVKEGDSVLTSSAEIVASTPSERVESTTLPTGVLKKTDNSLWIKGISPNTKAADLKAMFAKFGRVLTAKIFTRRQQPSNACFGFVTMVDAAAADLCIQKLHKTTVKGRLITVERADRCNMPVIKSIPKKTTSNATGDIKSGKSTSAVDSTSKISDEKKPSSAKTAEKPKKEASSADKPKSSTSGGDKASSSASSEKQKTVKTESETKKSPVKAPSASTTHSRFSTFSSSKRPTFTRPAPRFRAGRRIERVPSNLRRSYGVHKPSFSSAASRRTLGSRPISSRFGRGNVSRVIGRREVSSRRVEQPSSWEKREMMEMLRKKEEEHRLKEQELRLQRERERLKFERERFERERLELQQLRQIAALTTPVQSMMPAPAAPPPRRSHEYGDVDSSRYKSEKQLKRNDYSRRTGERSSSHRVSSSRTSLSDRREGHGSSRHVTSTHSSSRATTERNHDRSRDRSRHSSRDYGSSSVVRENVPSYGRDGHSYSRSGDPAVSSSYGRDPYRPDSTTYSSHRSGESGYGSRDFGAYGSSSTYSRDVAPSSYGKDTAYGSSSRSLGGGASWSVGGSSSAYVGSSRDYDSGAWMSGMSTSQSHGSHGLGSGNWSSSRDDHWSGSGMADSHGHAPSYDKYDKYDSYDKYSRRY